MRQISARERASKSSKKFPITHSSSTNLFYVSRFIAIPSSGGSVEWCLGRQRREEEERISFVKNKIVSNLTHHQSFTCLQFMALNNTDLGKETTFNAGGENE